MGKTKLLVLIVGLFIGALALVGCAGPAGPTGPAGPSGPAGPTGATGAAGASGSLVTVANVQPEACMICHEDVGNRVHQSVYNQYTDATKFKVTIDSVKSVANGSTFDATMTVTITKSGLPVNDADGLPSLDQKRFYTVSYDKATRMFDKSVAFGSPKFLGDGKYSVVAKGLAAAPESSNAEVYMYIADGVLETEGMTLYDDVYNAGKAYGDVSTYVSAANVSGCELCHGKPYMKHGYRAPEVAGLPDFASCKTCHYDTRVGGHQDWQILVDNPARYAEILAGSPKTDEEKAKYAYTANIMNDVHMSHSMEFPYPQSMANCATCHDGKLDMILTDANFKIQTCKSCHPVTGPADGTEANRAPALKTVLPASIHGNMDLDTVDCLGCHKAGGIAPVFSKIHTGYNSTIYADAKGTKYSEIFKGSIDSVTLSGNTLDIKFSVTANSTNPTSLKPANVKPTLMVGLYGYDTKDILVSPHGRSFDDNGDGAIDSKDSRDLEYVVGTDHKRMTTVSSGDGKWEVTADLSAWADKLADGSVKRAEIGFLPTLKNSANVTVALNAPSRTFDLTTNKFDDGYYKDIVTVVDGCNKCHDALATTFHSPDRGGNIKICRLCHTPMSGGSHLELQSRSIDSYVHAIHSFEAFDPGDIDFGDPVAAMRYDLHIEHTYPNFTIKNCQSCHNANMFNVPDQAKSLPGLNSGTDEITARNLGTVPAFVTGPASRACGGCHRADAIKEDAADELRAFNRHTQAGGYLIDNASGVLDGVIKTIMGIVNK